MEGNSYSAGGLMAVCAASGSVVLVAFQAHKRLVSHFMEKLESELRGCEKGLMKKKKVSFSKDVKEPSGDNEEYLKKRVIAKRWREEVELMSYCDRDSDSDGDEDPTVYDRRSMPENRLVLYRGLLDYKIQNKGRNRLLI